MKCKHQLEDGYVAVSLSGKLTGGPAFEKIHGEIKELLEKGHKQFLFNFAKVDWINSTGVGIMVSCYHSITSLEGRMVICGANDRVTNVYYVSQLDKIFETYASCDEAITALSTS